MSSQVWIALGSNLGDRAETIARAVERLAGLDLTPQRLSHLYETVPEGGAEEPLYLNAVLQAESDRDPGTLLRLLQEVEAEFGRPPRGGSRRGSGPRTLDLDLLAVGPIVLDEPGLVLPHPRLAERAFVLVPLCEVDPHWRHPRLDRSAASLLADLPVVPGAVRVFGSIRRDDAEVGSYAWRHLPAARGGHP